MVEEEVLGEAAELDRTRSRGIARQAPETKPGSTAELDGRLGRLRAARIRASPRARGSPAAAGPGDPGEVDDAARGVLIVRPPSAVTSPCHAAHPRPVGERRARSRPGSRSPRDGVGVQEQEQLAEAWPRPRLQPAAKPRFAPASITRRARARARGRRRRCRPRSRCRRRSARRRPGARRRARASARRTASRWSWVTMTTERAQLG